MPHSTQPQPFFLIAVLLAFGCGVEQIKGVGDRQLLEADATLEPVMSDANFTSLDAALEAEVDVNLSVDGRFTSLQEALERDLEHNYATAASVSVWLDEEIVWVGGFGVLEGDHPIDANTLFMIGSDTKKLTAIGLLQRVAAGEIKLETTLGEVLPDLSLPMAPEFAQATMHDLMTHQGGLVDDVGRKTTETDDEELARYTYEKLPEVGYALAPPGIFHNYSNPNYSMVGLVTETLSDAPWADIVEAEVFAPLEMRRTFARKSSVDINHAPGVTVNSGRPRLRSLEDTWENGFARPAGLVWSTPNDQIRLARFLVDGDPTILPDALRVQMHTPAVSIYPGFSGAYGYGLEIYDALEVENVRYPGVRAWTHGGNTKTHTSTFLVLPEARFAISILSNGTGDDFSESMWAAIHSFVALPKPEFIPDPSFDPDAIEALTGVYTDAYNVGEIIVRDAAERLMVEMPLLDAAGYAYEPQLYPISTRVWILRLEDTSLLLSFIDGPNGETYLANRIFVAIRPKPEEGASKHFSFLADPRRFHRALLQPHTEPRPHIFKFAIKKLEEHRLEAGDQERAQGGEFPHP